ncbi:Histidine kinase [Mucilaginibacter polytrichastri]|nr:Histidine kinase [Mucilaginibacter polytrichastri]
MQPLPFVFSGQLNWRLLRHLSFWLCWYLFQTFLYSFAPSPMLTKMNFWSRIQINLGESFFYLLPHVFFAYTLMYWVVPKMVITAKYFLAIVAVVILIVVTAGLSAFISIVVVESLRERYFEQYAGIVKGSVKTPYNIMIYMALLSGLRGSITIGGLAASIKLMKHFYEKQQQALLLGQQKAVAELQSLKAQLHPHFLFNTLNNIYSHAQDIAPLAADMLLRLSALLRYMLYSCSNQLVPLEQEVSMMMEYIELEKIRYGNQLEISIQSPPNYHDLLIAPLLILPFIENSFKHGTSGMLDKPWINIHISLKHNLMQLKLINGKANVQVEKTGGIGIGNVRRRLSLLYPGRHELTIIEEDELYIVNLSITLTASQTGEANAQLTYQTQAYAGI